MGAGHTHTLYVHEHSLVHRLPAHTKLVTAVAFVAVVAVTPRQAVGAFVVHGLALAAVTRLARVPARFVLARLAVVLPFVAFALALPFVASGERVEVLGIEMAAEGLWASWNVIAKAGLGAGTSILLAATTEVPDLLRAMTRLRVPAALTLIATFMVRYLELTAGELRRMRTALVARGYDPRWLWQIRPLAAASGALFVRSYERGERVHAAMVARGYTGTMPVDEAGQAVGLRTWAAAALLPALAASATAVAVLGG